MATAGVHYPSSEREFRSWFRDDNDCLDYLDWLRGNGQRICTQCGVVSPPKVVTGRVWRCPACKARVSRTAGTIFQDTRTPLTTWFTAAWELCVDKGGVSASSLQRRLDLGSYQTAWMMLHRYRFAMARSGSDKLRGRVEYDETVLGGVRRGVRGRGAADKVIVAVAVEQLEDGGFGRCRLRILEDYSAPVCRAFLIECIEPSSILITDGAPQYTPATAGLYTLDSTSLSGTGQFGHDVLPGVHRIASLLKRWLLGTHQGSFGHDHLETYLDEFTFRFNRRNSSRRGLLFYRLLTLAAQTGPLHYNDFVKNSVAKKVRPEPPTTKRVSSRSLQASPAERPWRGNVPIM